MTRFYLFFGAVLMTLCSVPTVSAQWWRGDGISRFDLTSPQCENWFRFDRDVATVDPQGAGVSADSPRFRSTRAISGVWGDPQVVSDQLVGADINDDVTILAAGRDRDWMGSAVLVVLSHNGRQFAVSTQQGNSFRTSPRNLLTIRAAPGITSPALAVGDIRTNLVDAGGGTAIDQVCYEPATGSVCFGTIVVLCREYRYAPADGWKVVGFAIFYSTDYGANFVKYFDDAAVSGNRRQIGKSRIASWSLQGWFCPYHNCRPGTDRHHCHEDHDDDCDLDTRPDEAVMTFTDYRYAPNDPDCADPDPNDLPAGGRAGFFKLKPDNSGVYVPLSVNSVPAVGIFEINANSFLDPTHYTAQQCANGVVRKSQVNYMHFHSLGVTEFSAGNPETRPWQLLLGVGDTVASSAIRIIVADSRDNAYWKQQVGTTQNWTVQYNWHGSIDSAMLSSTRPTQRASDSNTGFGFVGCAPGPERGTLLLGQDAIGEAGMMARPSTTLSTEKTLSPLFPSGGPSFESALMFNFHTDAPHLQLRTVVCDRRLSVSSSPFLPQTLPGLDTVAFSRSSGAPGTWGEMPLMPILPDRTDSYKDNVFVVGNFVYLVQADIYRSSGLPAYSQRVVRRKLPTVIPAISLLQVGPGGTQLLREAPAKRYETGLGIRPSTTSENTPAAGAGRNWKSVTLDGSPPANLPIQPPMASGFLARLARPRTLLPTAAESEQTQFGYLFPTNRGSGPLSSYFSTYGERWLTFRAWVLNSSRSNDSPQRLGAMPRAESEANLELNFSGHGIPVGSVVGNDTWYCVVGSAKVAVGGPGDRNVEFLQIKPSTRRRSDGSASGVFDPQLLTDTDCYFGLSELVEGDQEIGYPLPSCADRAGVTYPPERVDVALSRTQQVNASGDFTFYFAGTVPEDSWDTTPLPAGTTNVTRFPLVTLVTEDDDDAWITVSASPRYVPGTNPILPSLMVDVGTRNHAGVSGSLGPAAWIRGRSLIGVMVYDASEQKLRVSAALSGQRLPDLELHADLRGKTFKYIRFGDRQSGTDRKVGAFQWAGVAVQGDAIGRSHVSRALRTLYFVEPDAD